MSDSEILRKRGEARALLVFKTCAAAKLAPVSASVLKAVDMILHEPAEVGLVDGSPVDAGDIATALRAAGARGIEKAAASYAATWTMPVWRAMSKVLIKRCPGHGRRSAA